MRRNRDSLINVQNERVALNCHLDFEGSSRGVQLGLKIVTKFWIILTTQFPENDHILSTTLSTLPFSHTALLWKSLRASTIPSSSPQWTFWGAGKHNYYQLRVIICHSFSFGSQQLWPMRFVVTQSRISVIQETRQTKCNSASDHFWVASSARSAPDYDFSTS